MKRKKLLPMPKLVKKADTAFSKWIRARDKECVLKNKKCSSVLQCGHLIRRGKRSVRFDEFNCNAQCSYHNFLHNSEPHHYTDWFIREYGSLPYEDLCDRARRIKKFTRQELEDIIKKYEAH